MVATPARIGFVIEPYRRATSETPAVATRHGNLARETDDPLETYFASLVDAQSRADARQALLSPDRRRFSVPVVDVDFALGLLDADQITTARFIDEERGVDMPVIITEVVIDAEGGSAQLKVWG